MNKTTKPIQLTQANLENAGWLFSATLKVMIHEHELGGGKWDIEIDGYKEVDSATPGGKGAVWTFDSNVYFDSVLTVKEAITKYPELGTVRDWVHGDSVEMW